MNTPIPPTRILAIANQKGGVGKTTTAINIGAALAACGQSVLIIDLDPQGNATTGLGVPNSQRRFTSYDLLLDQTRPDAAIPTAIPNLHILPASRELSGVDVEFAAAPKRTHILSNHLKQWQNTQKIGTEIRQPQAYTTILIDCPPALSLLTINALTTAHAVLIPMQCEFFALEGLAQLLNIIKRVQTRLNPDLDIQGIILSMFDSRNKMSHQVADDIRSHFGSTVYETVIPRNIKLAEAPSHGLPAIIYDFHCRGSQAYLHLAREMIHREQDLHDKQKPQ